MRQVRQVRGTYIRQLLSERGSTCTPYRRHSLLTSTFVVTRHPATTDRSVRAAFLHAALEQIAIDHDLARSARRVERHRCGGRQRHLDTARLRAHRDAALDAADRHRAGVVHGDHRRARRHAHVVVDRDDAVDERVVRRPQQDGGALLTHGRMVRHARGQLAAVGRRVQPALHRDRSRDDDVSLVIAGRDGDPAAMRRDVQTRRAGERALERVGLRDGRRGRRSAPRRARECRD